MAAVTPREPYTIYIETGPSRTTVEVLNKDGVLVPLLSGNERALQFIARGCRTDPAAVKAITSVLHPLFENIQLADQKIQLSLLAKRAKVVASFSDFGQQKKVLQRCFDRFQIKKLQLLSNQQREVARIEDEGLALHVGMSIYCQIVKRGISFGKKQGDGGGYKMALQALQKALEREKNKTPSRLLDLLKQHFQVETLNQVLELLVNGSLDLTQVGEIVIQALPDSDAKKIVDEVLETCQTLILAMLEKTTLKAPKFYLFGRISIHNLYLVEKIREFAQEKQILLQERIYR